MRWRRVPATLPAIVGWMIEGTKINAECVRGLPPGTIAVGSIQEDLTRVSLIVEHESFDEIKVCPVTKDAIPIHPDPMFRTQEQQADAIDARYKQAFERLVEDLGLQPMETPEDIRAGIRMLVLNLRKTVQTRDQTIADLEARCARLLDKVNAQQT